MSHDEVARVPSPDKKVAAVLVETNGGATTSFGYEVRLDEAGHRHSEKVAWLVGATRSNTAWGANLKWTGNDNLSIEYLQAEQSRILKSKVNLAGRDIEISLRSGIEDPLAPGGGMFYNRERAQRQNK